MNLARREMMSLFPKASCRRPAPSRQSVTTEADTYAPLYLWPQRECNDPQKPLRNFYYCCCRSDHNSSVRSYDPTKGERPVKRRMTTITVMKLARTRLLRMHALSMIHDVYMMTLCQDRWYCINNNYENERMYNSQAVFSVPSIIT